MNCPVRMDGKEELFMKRRVLLQEVRKMRFEEAYEGWKKGQLTQEEAARLLGVCYRTFRRYLHRYEDKGMKGQIDQRLEQVPHSLHEFHFNSGVQ